MGSPVSSSFASRFKFWDNLCRDSPGTRQCGGCKRAVYAAEQVLCLDQIWHRGCLQCSKCHNRLSQSNYNDVDHVLFCDKCYRQELATNYLFSRRTRSPDEISEHWTLETLQNLSLSSAESPQPYTRSLNNIEQDEQRCSKSELLRTGTEFAPVENCEPKLPFGNVRDPFDDTDIPNLGYSPIEAFCPRPTPRTIYVHNRPLSDTFPRSKGPRPGSPERHHGIRYGNGSGWKLNWDVDEHTERTVELTPPKPARRFSSALDNVERARPSVREIADKINHAGTQAGGVIGVRTHHFCGRCNKTVHPDEREKCLGRTWHRDCIQCSKCGKALRSAVGYFDYSINDVLFCDACLPNEMKKRLSSRRRTDGDLKIPKDIVDLGRDESSSSNVWV